MLRLCLLVIQMSVVSLNIDLGLASELQLFTPQSCVFGGSNDESKRQIMHSL
jgi:hypothetical protein